MFFATTSSNYGYAVVVFGLAVVVVGVVVVLVVVVVVNHKHGDHPTLREFEQFG